MPQEFKDLFLKKGIDVHDPKYGTWWEKTTHLEKAAEHNRKWADFLEESRTPSEILNYGRQIMNEYNIPVNY